jgi:two-component system heavy metal sensor histidine kinase CusS
LGVIGFASFYLNFSLARLFQKEGNRELVEKADLVMDRLDTAAWPEDGPEPADEEGRTVPVPEIHLDPDVLMDTENLQVRIVSHDGKILLESQGLSRLLPQARMPKLGTWTWQDVDGPTGAQFLVYSRPFDHGWILTAWDIRYENRLLRKSQDLLYLTWGLATLLTGLFTVFFTRRGLAPLKLLAEKAEAIRPGSLRLDLDPARLPSELEPLAEKLQSALARLDEAFSRLTTLNADVAHELRTPLHGIRLEVEGLLRGAHLPPADQERVEGLLETLDYLAATLDQMLFLARAEDPSMALNPAPLDVPALLESAAAPFASLAEEKGTRLEARAPVGMVLHADELLVRRALHNLLANALRHTPADRLVRVEGLLEAGCVILQVRDEGEGMPEAFLARIGMRFQRPDSSRTRASGGAGLGLAIVGTIMRLHGGDLEIQSEPGKGTVAKLRFPA